MHFMLACNRLPQAEPVGNKRLDAGDGTMQVFALVSRQQAGEGHGRIFRQQQQLCARIHGFTCQRPQAGGIVIPALAQGNGILAGGETQHQLMSLSQNDMGFAVCSLSPTSRQVNFVRSSGWWI